MKNRAFKEFEEILRAGNKQKIIKALSKAANDAIDDIYIHKNEEDGNKNLKTVLDFIEEYHQRYPYLRVAMTSYLIHYINTLLDQNRRFRASIYEVKVGAHTVELIHHGNYHQIGEYLRNYKKFGDEKDLERALDIVSEAENLIKYTDPTILEEALDQAEEMYQAHVRRESNPRYFLQFRDHK
jgi:hypothetical protein